MGDRSPSMYSNPPSNRSFPLLRRRSRAPPDDGAPDSHAGRSSFYISTPMSNDTQSLAGRTLAPTLAPASPMPPPSRFEEDLTALPQYSPPEGPPRMTSDTSGDTLVSSIDAQMLGKTDSTADKVDPEHGDSPPLAVFKADWTIYLAFMTIAVLTLMVALDSTALSVALPVMAQKLHGDALEAFWSATSYLLTSTVFQPTAASLSDVFGRKWTTVCSGLLFLAGIIIAALANDFLVLLVGRTIQGIGGGAVEVLAQLIICDLIPLRLRGQWFGVISAMYAVGTVSGPLLGGVFAQKVTWRWIFWINVPFVTASIIMTPICIKLGAPKGTRFWHGLLRIDWVGSALFVAATTSLLIPLSWGGVQYPWDSWHTLVPLFIGPMGYVLLWIYESRWAKNPIIITRIFKSRNVVIAYITIIFHGLIVTTLLYYLPLYYQAAKGLTPILSAVALFPETFTVAPSAFIIGALIARFNSYRWAIWSGWGITCLGCGILYLLDVDTSTGKWIVLNLVVGIGVGFNYVAIGVMLQASVREEDLTSAIAILTVCKPYGQAVGVAVGGVIFQNRFRNKLSAIPEFAAMASHYSNDASGLAQIIQQMQAGDRKDTLSHAYTDSLKMIWGTLCGFAGLALILSIPIIGISLDRDLQPTQYAAQEDAVEASASADRGTESPDSVPEKAKQMVGEEEPKPKRRFDRLRSKSTVGSRPTKRGSVVSKRASTNRYSREIGGFHSFPMHLTQSRVYRPERNSRPDSLVLLPFPQEQPSLSGMIDSHFGRQGEERRF